MPCVGDRVMIEASYNASMLFKWNAYRIQLLPNENVPQMQQHSAPSQQLQRSHNGPEARWSGSSHVDRIRERSPRDRLLLEELILHDVHCSTKNAVLHQHYTNLYIPSDFVTCEFSWLNSFTLDSPFTLSPSPITIHVVNKDVDVLLDEGETLPSELPADADSRYSARVLMLAHPGVSVVRQKGLLPDGSIDESTETQPITRALQFLVGKTGGKW